MHPQNTKPVFLNLLQIKLPWMGIASILHRVTGVLLFLAIPLAFYLFGRSLEGESGFNQVVGVLGSLPFKLLTLLLLWVLLHHLLAGIRFLLIDLDIGVTLPQARHSALGAIISGVLLAPIAWLLIL